MFLLKNLIKDYYISMRINRMKMNKRILLSIMFACILISVHAQIAKWMVRPNYDHIEMLDCGLMKVSMNGKIGLLNDIGKEILPLKYDSITAFKEGYALLFSNGAFCAIIDTQGHIINVADKHEDREEVMRVSGQRTVPVIDIDGEIIVGFDKKKIEEAME